MFIELPNLPNYFISEEGILKNKHGKIMRACDNGCGYLRFCIKGKGYLLHRLVAQVFCERIDDSFNIVEHIDNDPKNNHYTNLRWSNQSRNVKNAYKDGLIRSRKGINNPNYRSGKYIKALEKEM
jgi:hypothetical protein